MNKSKNIAGVLANKGSSAFRETFQHTSNDVLNYFPGHMAKGKSRKQVCRKLKHVHLSQGWKNLGFLRKSF